MAVKKLLTLLQIELPYRRVRFWLALVGFAAFLVVAFTSFFDRTAYSEWGISIQRDGDVARVVWVQPSGLAWGRGVRLGDSIVEINGDGLNDLDLSVLRKVDAMVVISRDTGRMLTIASNIPLDISLALSLFAAGILFAVIGSSVLLWAPKTNEALAFYALSLSSAIVFALAISEPSGKLWNARLLFPVTILSASFQAYFFLVFPKDRLLRLAPTSYIVIFLPASLLIVLFVLSSFSWQSLYELVRPMAYVVHSLLYLTAIGAFLWSFLELRREGAAGRLLVPILGTLTAIVGTVVTTLLPLGLASKPLIPPQLGALFQVLIPASFAYAILRHRLLGFSGVIRRAMINFFVGLALLASFATLSIAVNRMVAPEFDHELVNLMIEVLFVAIALVILPALHNVIRRFVDRAFFRDVYEHDKALQSVTRTLSSARSADALASQVVDTLVNALNLTFAAVVLHDVGGHPEIIASTPETSRSMTDDIKAMAETVSADENEQGMFDGKAGGLNLTYVPLVSGGVFTGLLCLGPKQNGLNLSQRDSNLLANVATQLAMGLDNARLLQTVRRNLSDLHASAAELKEGQRKLRELNHRLLMAEEKERRRLAADLHDEPLQRIMMLLRHMDGCPGVRKAKNRACKNLAAEAATSLRRVCVDFHPPLLEDLGLASALEWLVSNFNKSSKMIVSIEIDPEFGSVQLRPDAQIALYRVAQEALNNTVRHSGATSVFVSLSLSINGEEVVVTVKDDGHGFQMPESLSNLSVDGHMGLIGMRERMDSVGGRLEIFTEPGSGTEVTAILKCNAKGENRSAAGLAAGALTHL